MFKGPPRQLKSSNQSIMLGYGAKMSEFKEYFYNMIHSFQISIKHMKKTYSNHFMPGLFNLNGSYCEFANETSVSSKFWWNTIKTLNAEFYDEVKKNVKYCPVMVGTTQSSTWTRDPLICQN
jgi:hypothetical protein